MTLHVALEYNTNNNVTGHEPKICINKSVNQMNSLLPSHNYIRLENDCHISVHKIVSLEEHDLQSGINGQL